MTPDKTETLVREALADQAARAVDPGHVLRGLQRGRRRSRTPVLVFAAAAAVIAAVSAVVIPMRSEQQAPAAAPVERTILVMGRDTVDRMDTIMLTSLTDGRATAISVPRDAVVDIPGYGQGKANSGFARARAAAVASGKSPAEADKAGAETMVSMVRALTGAAIDDYLVVDMSAIGAAATAVGGVEVCLRAATSDRFAEADFPAGKQTLSGAAALAFVRQRHGLPNGDLDRITRQQVFLAGLLDRVTAENAGEVLAAVAPHVVTDADLLGLAQGLADRRGGVGVAVIPLGAAVESASGFGFEVSPQAVRTFVESAMAGDVPAGPDCVN